jgi:hypothetical protein
MSNSNLLLTLKLKSKFAKSFKKMRKFKFLFIVIFLFVGMFFVVQSCQKDEFIDETETSKFNLEVIGINEFINNEKVIHTNELISKYFDFNVEDGNARSEVPVSDFIISTDKIVHVTTDSTETFSFQIKTPTATSSTFENFVVEVRDSINSYFIYRFQQNDDDSEFPYSNDRESLSVEDVNLADFQDFLSPELPLPDGCYEIIECDCEGGWGIIIIDCPGGGTDGVGTGADTGDNLNNPTGGVDSNTGQEGGDYSGATGGAGSNTNGSNYSPTGVNMPTYQEQILNCIGVPSTDATGFNYAQWLYDSSTNYFDIKAIATFLNNSGCSQQAQEFAIQAMEALANGLIDEFDNDEFILGIVFDQSFENSQLECIYYQLLGNYNESNFFKDMLKEFSGSSGGSLLTYSIDELGEAHGLTKSENISFNGVSFYNSYNIINDFSVEQGSNLHKMVNLVHETMHAYMFVSLEQWGIIEFTIDGEPDVIDITSLCENTSVTNGIDLNTLTIQERWVYLLCEIYYANNNNLPYEWSHELFNTAYFDLNTYREKLEQLLLEKHDWDNEPDDLKDLMILAFGIDNWKQKCAEYMSWSGLNETIEFQNWHPTQTSIIPDFAQTNDSEVFYYFITENWTSAVNTEYTLHNCN